MFIFVGACLMGQPEGAMGQPSDSRTTETYQSLWKRGEYQKALDVLSAALETANFGGVTVGSVLDHVELLQAVGKYDEAIEEMKEIAERFPEPVFSVPLAVQYQYRGRKEDYQKTIALAMQQAQGEIHYRPIWENLLAVAKLSELQGENPKQILTAFLNPLMQRMPREISSFIAAGDLARRHYSYDVAADYYMKALEIDDENQNALAGLAECFWSSTDPRLERTLAALLTLNPNHPRARALAVEALLDSNKPAEALNILDEGLKINPNDLHFHALRAAAQFLQDKPAAMKQDQKRALDFNPHWAEVYSVPGRVAARHYRFEEAVAMLRKAVELNPEDNAAKAELAFNLLRLGEQTEGREILEATFKADPFNVQAYNMLQVLDAIDAFKTIKQGKFAVQLPEQESKVLLREMLATLDEATRMFEAKYQVRLTTPVLVQMFDDHDEFMVRSVGLPGSTGHLGICFGRLLTMDSPRARPVASSNWRAVLWHEFVHVITLQKTKNRMPRWLSEGISVYEQEQGSAAWGEKLDPRFKPMVQADGFPTMAQLESFFTRPKSQMHLILGYFLAGEFTKFYVKEYGETALRESLEMIAEGTKAEEALIKAAGTTEKLLDGKLNEYLTARCAILDNIPTPPMAVEADETEAEPPTPGIAEPDPGDWMALPSPFTTALKKGQEAIKERDWPAAIAAMEEAHKLYPEYTGDDAPLRELARIYAAQEDKEKEREALRAIVNWDWTAFAEARRLVALEKEAGAWEKAAQAARMAFDINPFDAANVRDLHESLMAQGELEQSLHSVDALITLDPPRAIDYRLARARLLAQTGDKAAARAETITLLEETPYYWNAQELLLDLAEGKEPAHEVLR